MSKLKTLMDKRCFGGRQLAFSHLSESTHCEMEFSVFLPPQAEKGSCPVLWYLSGLTCTWKNVTEKGHFQQACAESGIILVAPDTSPRGEGVANDESYDMGQGAGFYVDATQDPWRPHYQMSTYITNELRGLVESEFPVQSGSQGICGHSMGGHGALTLAFRFPELFQSVSAFAPICHPSAVPWGQKALGHYLGSDRGPWAQYDATELVAKTSWSGSVLIDQGGEDEFLQNQLKPNDLIRAAEGTSVEIQYREQAGYDHSYYFVSTFLPEHIRWHAERLGSA